MIIVIGLLFIGACNNSVNYEVKPPSDIEINRINKSYVDWVNKMVESGDYSRKSVTTDYYSKTFSEKGSETTDFWDNCKTGLPDSVFIDKHYGDINQDGIIDCSGKIWPHYCDAGTSRNFDDIHIFILSNIDSSYNVIFEPEHISDDIGPAGSLDSILPDGTLRYKAVFYALDDALCCPSIEKKMFFELESNKSIFF